MALELNEKVKISGILKNKDDFFYEDFCLNNRKYTDDELISFVLDIITKYLKNNEEIKANTLRRHFYALYVIFERCYVVGIELSDDVSKRTMHLKEDYDDYLARLRLESNQEVKRQLLNLVELVCNNRSNIDESFLREDTEVVFNETDKEEQTEKEEISSEEIKIQNLENEIKNLETKIKSYEKESKKTTSKLNALTEKKKSLEKQLHECKEQLNRSVKENNKFQKEFIKLEKTLEKATETIDSLNVKINMLDIDNKELIVQLKKEEANKMDLEQTLKKKQKKLETYFKQEQREEELQAILKKIILLISQKQMTTKEIKEELKNQGFEITDEELQNLLRRIKNQISVEPSNKTIPRSYYVERFNKRNSRAENKTFRLISNGVQEIKILLVADAHSDIKYLRSFDIYKYLYDYSLKNKISNIFLLGDFFDCSRNFDISKEIYDAIAYYQENIVKFLEKYPYSDEITNAFLGGNHERIMFDVGISPVDLIADSRLDFTSLGYNDAEIMISKDKIALHHPNRVSNASKEREVENYLKNYYNNYSLEKNDTYIDIFGHFHTNCLSQTNGYLLLPSLTRNSDGIKGACEMRIYLNDNGYIDNIIFIPLIFNKKDLVSTGTIEYKKLVLENKQN